MVNNKLNTNKETDNLNIGFVYIFVIVTIPFLLLFCITKFLTLSGTVDNLSNIEFKKNICVKLFNGGNLEEVDFLNKNLILNYELESDNFNMDCYEELVSHMETINVSDIFTSYTATKANINLNGKSYIFIIPESSNLVNNLNVGSLIEFIDN